jgi:hypothetical protein
MRRTIFGKPLSDYVAFCKVFLILLPLVGIVRLALSLSGTPDATARWFSMTVLAWIAFVYCGVRVHTTGFGSYKQLLVICVLLNLSTQVISIAAILLAALSGTQNIFSSPDFSFGVTPWLHAASHVLIGVPAGSLVGWLIGSLVLAVTKRVARVSNQTGRSAI